MHKTEDLIKGALTTSIKEQRAVFKQCKRNGIMKYNLSVMGDRDAVFHRERRPKTADGGKEVVCEKCKGVFARNWYYEHKKMCVGDSIGEPKAIPANVCYASDKVSDDFKMNILTKFRQDEIGIYCQTCEMVKYVGSRLNLKINSRKDKEVEVRRSVMSDMRRLVGLFFEFRTEWVTSFRGDQDPHILDMFNRRHFAILETACMHFTVSDREEQTRDKCGLMINLYYLLVKVAKIIRVYQMTRDNDDSARDVAQFLEVLAFNKNTLIGGAVYNTNKARNTRLRRQVTYEICSIPDIIKSFQP